MLMTRDSAPLADQIVDTIARSDEEPSTVVVTLAALLGSVCREGCVDLDNAVEIARFTAEVEIKRGGSRGA